MIQDVEHCAKERERQFNNKEKSETLNCDPTTTNNETVTKLHQDLKKKIVKNISDAAKTENPKTPRF